MAAHYKPVEPEELIKIVDSTRKQLSYILDTVMDDMNLPSPKKFLENNWGKEKDGKTKKEYVGNPYPAQDDWSSFGQAVNPLFEGVDNRHQLCVDVGTNLRYSPDKLKFENKREEALIREFVSPINAVFSDLNMLEDALRKMTNTLPQGPGRRTAEDAAAMMEHAPIACAYALMDLGKSINGLNEALKKRKMIPAKEELLKKGSLAVNLLELRGHADAVQAQATLEGLAAGQRQNQGAQAARAQAEPQRSHSYGMHFLSNLKSKVRKVRSNKDEENSPKANKPKRSKRNPFSKN